MVNFQDVLRDVHNPVNHSLHVDGSGATIYAVVNTGAAGVQNSMVTLNAGPNQIGSITVSNPVNLGTRINSIGFASVIPVQAWPDPHVFIGLTTVVQGGDWLLGAHAQYIGLASVNIGGTLPALSNGVNNIGFASVTPVQAWPDPKTYIGLTTATIGNNPILGAGINGIGFATVKVDSGTQFIGLVTAVTRNAGTNKTLIPLPIGISTNSIATIAIPTNVNKINVTNLVLNANVTTAIAIKSGVTYLTGNASLAMTIFPGGGFVLPGSVDSPSWIGLPSGALVIEKRDAGGTVANIAGGVIYFDE